MLKGNGAYKPDDEKKIAKIVQADDKGLSVKDRGGALNDSSLKSDPNVGSYDGCPDPVAGTDFQGSGIKGELDSLQEWTKNGGKP